MQTLPLLFSSLPDKAPRPQAVVEQPAYNKVLSGLSKLCIPAELFEIFVIRLTAKLDILCSPFDYDDSEVGLNLAYIYSVLVAIADTLSNKVDQKHADVPKYIDRLVPYLLDSLILSSSSSGKQNMIATDHRIVAVTAQIFALIVEMLPLGFV
jgi:DNA repair/transcription protein MET18/MMS19